MDARRLLPLVFILAVAEGKSLMASRQAEGAMKFALDGMVEFMEGGGSFDDDFYGELVECFDRFDPNLMEAQDTEWDGMLKFAETGGTKVDKWLNCTQLEQLGLVRDKV